MKNRKIYMFTAFIISTALFLCFSPNSLGLNNSIYAIEQLHAYDSGLFTGNPAIMFGEKTPRIFMNWLFKQCMQLFSLSWEDTAFWITYAGVLPYSFGTVNAVWRLCDKNRLLYTVLLTIFIARGITSGFPGWTTFEPDTLGLGIAFGFSLAAVSYVIGEQKNWLGAWIMLSLSMLFHVHEGIWGCAALFLLWAAEAIEGRALSFRAFRGFPIYAAAAVLCILPSLMSNAGTLPDREFVRIYANIRTPHHLVPSSWGWKTTGSYFLLLLYPAGLYLQFCYRKQKDKMKPFIWKTVICLLSWLAALAVTWFFTEAHPSSLIVTMTVPKFFRYISLLAIFVYLSVIKGYLDRKNPAHALCICNFAFISHRGGVQIWMLYAILVLMACFEARDNCLVSGGPSVLYLLLTAAFMPVLPMNIMIMALAALLCCEYLPGQNIRGKFVYLAYTGCMAGILLCAGYGKFFNVHGHSVSIRSGKDALIRSCTEDIYGLANDFRDLTEKDEMFLADPYAGTGKTEWFQVISQRSGYVFWKTVPSSKRSIEEWFNRLMRTQNLCEKSCAEVYGLLNEMDIDYLLIDRESYQSYEQYENSELFELFLRSDNDTFRVYKKTGKEEGRHGTPKFQKI